MAEAVADGLCGICCKYSRKEKNRDYMPNFWHSTASWVRCRIPEMSIRTPCLTWPVGMSAEHFG